MDGVHYNTSRNHLVLLQNGDDFYIIDMALAATSALSECVPKGMLKAEKEDWLPKLTEKKGD